MNHMAFSATIELSNCIWLPTELRQVSAMESNNVTTPTELFDQKGGRTLRTWGRLGARTTSGLSQDNLRIVSGQPQGNLNPVPKRLQQPKQGLGGLR